MEMRPGSKACLGQGLLVLVIFLGGVIFIALAEASSPEPLRKPWLLPFDIGQKRSRDPVVLQPSQKQVYEFAWDSFIALNWPYLVTTPSGKEGLRGQPDPSAPGLPIFGDSDPLRPSPMVVWESYFTPDEVFVDNPDPDNYPVVWGSPDFLDIDSGLKELRPAGYNGQFAPGINQPYTHANVPTGPVVDQNKNYLRYEVTLNQSFFSYIATFKYFSADVQKRVVQNYVNYAWDNGEPPPSGDTDYFQPLPVGTEAYVLAQPDYAQQGLTEVKAAWKVLQTEGENADIPERYFRRSMKIPTPDGSYETKLVGLVGLHVHRVTPFGHLPSTFEHVDNVELNRVPGDPLPLPKTPSLNPGQRFSQFWSRSGGGYPNGYEVNGLSGQPGLIPQAFMLGDALPPVDERRAINVSRVDPIADAVQEVNREYRVKLKDSVLRYYQLVGAQNESGTRDNPFVEINHPFLGPGIPNENLGPGIPGAQYSNTPNLINTTLESYTQRGFSCARCHLNAFPQGVEAYPPFEKRFAPLHVMSFLLLSAQPEDD